MADNTRIEWADATWNPVTGCTKTSDGCRYCYAAREWQRLSANPRSVYFGRRFTDVQCHPERLSQPGRWTRPRIIFVNSMADLFHDEVPDAFVEQVFDAMAEAPRHVFLVLTKRAERMCRWVQRYRSAFDRRWQGVATYTYSYAHVWIGVSVEDQRSAAQRVPYLLDTPAAVRWISAEPLIGPLDLTHLDADASGHPTLCQVDALTGRHRDMGRPCADVQRVDWVVVGGESGGAADVRLMSPEWPRSLRDQCARAGVPMIFKQWGSAAARTDRMLDGEIIDQWPGGARPCCV